MSRRKARLTAVQYIYSKSFDTKDSPREFMDYLESPKKENDKDFAQMLIEGALDKKDEIKELISRYAEQGDDIISLVDRCILSVGIFELLYVKETPPPVVIDEYVEIAKELSKDSSRSFINAVMDKVRMEYDEK